MEYHRTSEEIEGMVLHKFDPTILLQVLISKWSFVIWVKSLSVKIDILASSGISILIPDMPVTSI